MYNRRDVLQLGGAALSAILACPPTSNAAEFTAKQITIYVGFSPTSGIGYDTYARALSQVIGKYLPGNPTVIVGA
jgi:tripartite-type tricarboxylate transporter receptor subunit TctC